jgi:hypothetical protein
VSDSASAADAVSIRRPPPSTYLWTADGRIRGLARSNGAIPASEEKGASAPSPGDPARA